MEPNNRTDNLALFGNANSSGYQLIDPDVLLHSPQSNSLAVLSMISGQEVANSNYAHDNVLISQIHFYDCT